MTGDIILIAQAMNGMVCQCAGTLVAKLAPSHIGDDVIGSDAARESVDSRTSFTWSSTVHQGSAIIHHTRGCTALHVHDRSLPRLTLRGFHNDRGRTTVRPLARRLPDRIGQAIAGQHLPLASPANFTRAGADSRRPRRRAMDARHELRRAFLVYPAITIRAAANLPGLRITSKTTADTRSGLSPLLRK